MRRGSALLVVLGMLSFMVVSAVAFSVYMRSSRLPSSYLLRVSSSRNLVKAGLAEALDEIDRAIGNNPHPGVGTVTSLDSGGDPVMNRNQWRERVFLGTNRMVNVDQTVSTLTLEGLAYVPAPLINEVRYYSRRSAAAAWHSLGFDAGRFAFTAVDVSDYYDVNRAMAAPGGGGRTSADDGRVSLAYLFEDAGHAGWRTPPSVWDAFMDNYLDGEQQGSKVPLVSWADLNLAIWDKKPAGVLSPWCRFVADGTAFVQDSPAERQALSNMVFVTDSYSPLAKAEAGALNLDDGAKQPFYGLNIRDRTAYRNRGVDELAQNNNDFMRKFADNISLPELVQLCDYLDADSVPTSLAMPTTERVPMVTGVSLNAGSELRFEMSKSTREIDKPGSETVPARKYVVTRYTLKLVGELHPMVGFVYPFKYGRGSEDSDTFRAQVAATLTLVPSGSERALRRRNAASPAVCPWDVSQKSPEPVAYNGAGDFKSVVIMRSTTKPLPVKRNPKTEQDCLLAADFEFGGIGFDMAGEMPPLPFDPSATKDVCTLRVVQEVDPDTGAPVGDAADVAKGFLPSNADLSGTFKSAPDDVPDGDSFVPVIQLWVRVVNAAGDTVDLMPACVADDRRPSDLVRSENNGKNLHSASERPLLRFYDKGGSMSVNFAKSWFEGFANKLMTIAPHAYVADDPRFNHAPEDLVAVESLTGEVQEYWRANNTSANGDGDIFMATSDAGYLQSKFELSYLLRVTGLFGNDMWGVLNSGDYNGEARTAFGNAPSRSVQWRTYSQYAVNGVKDDIDRLEMYNGARGTRVCPYTPDTAVMMGALANTPRDWWAASTNDVGSVKQQMLADVKEALKYAFSERSADDSCKVRWRDLEALANRLTAEFRRASSVDGWRDAYDGFDWDGSFFDDLESGSNVRLDAVDRKYLFGFWRDCFAVRQQLFLVFVRAEPMMMGGGAAGQMPPMLGARAVALVWRDPNPTQNNAPHRMRLLFYRQLD